VVLVLAETVQKITITLQGQLMAQLIEAVAVAVTEVFVLETVAQVVLGLLLSVMYSLKMSCLGCKSTFATKEETEKRRSICMNCDTKKGIFCGGCKCLIGALVTFQNAKCVENKW
jgi:hypothetical protein